MIATPVPCRLLPAYHRFVWLLLLPLSVWGGGCASFTNPVAYDGIPVNRVPEGVLGRPRAELLPLPLNLFRQKENVEYLVEKGDVLGIVAEESLSAANQPTPVQVIQNPNAPRNYVLGYPIPVQEDGTIILPRLPPLDVKGLTLAQIREKIAKAMTGGVKFKEKTPDGREVREFVAPGTERVLVDLIQPRRYTVYVVRENAQTYNPQASFAGVTGQNRKGAGYTLQMDAYKNDILRALNATGGPPGLDAVNEVVIRRGQYDPQDPSKGYIRIPLRARPDDPLTFTEKDIILKDGDTVYIGARDTEVYYTAGLMGGAQIPLPRDYDLRIVEAIAQVRGPLVNGSFTQNAFVAQAVNTGVGNPNPSLVTVIRHTANNKMIHIRVDLNLAMRDQRENILVQPADILVLQEKPGEALTRYLTQTIRLTTSITPIRTDNTIFNGISTNP